jgi:transposase-like protein
MECLAQSLGMEGISAGQVSAMTKGLAEQVAQFRSRPLEKEYPVIWVDALYEKIRFDGRVISMAVLVVAGITLDGRRDILACEPMMNESEETYGSLFEGLKGTVWLLCVSDAHRGLRKALQKAFLGCSRQRVQGSLHAQRHGPCIAQGKGILCGKA